MKILAAVAILVPACWLVPFVATYFVMAHHLPFVG